MAKESSTVLNTRSFSHFEKGMRKRDGEIAFTLLSVSHFAPLQITWVLSERLKQRQN